MLGGRRRRRPNIKTTLAQRLVFAGDDQSTLWDAIKLPYVAQQQPDTRTSMLRDRNSHSHWLYIVL